MRLRFIVEGRTEANFADHVLAQHLAGFGVWCPSAQLVATRRDWSRGVKHSGGLTSWARVRRELDKAVRGDSSDDLRFTTMFDYYALPGDFPGLDEADGISDVYSRMVFLERRIAEEIGDDRLIPHVQLHEFEALVFADVSKIGEEYFGADKAIEELRRQAEEFENPEMIDGGHDTAPSKRIVRAIPDYDKANAGVVIVQHIGLETLKRRCRHFAAWLGRLESLGGEGFSR